MKKMATITVTEGKDGIEVRIRCLPSVGKAGACATLGMIGFQAIVNAYRKAAGEELEMKTEREAEA